MCTKPPSHHGSGIGGPYDDCLQTTSALRWLERGYSAHTHSTWWVPSLERGYLSCSQGLASPGTQIPGRLAGGSVPEMLLGLLPGSLRGGAGTTGPPGGGLADAAGPLRRRTRGSGDTGGDSVKGPLFASSILGPAQFSPKVVRSVLGLFGSTKTAPRKRLPRRWRGLGPSPPHPPQPLRMKADSN